jgi:glycosyltransferase involved in cell wall biosynthesis
LGVYLGVMGAQDGVDYLLRAIAHVVHTFGYHQCHFALIGGGDMYPDLVKLSHELNLTDFVEFTGRIPTTTCCATSAPPTSPSHPTRSTPSTMSLP